MSVESVYLQADSGRLCGARSASDLGDILVRCFFVHARPTVGFTRVVFGALRKRVLLSGSQPTANIAPAGPQNRTRLVICRVRAH